jgi:hypothetical protein
LSSSSSSESMLTFSSDAFGLTLSMISFKTLRSYGSIGNIKRAQGTRRVSEKVPQNVAQSKSCGYKYTTFTLEKDAQLFLPFLKFAHKVNSRPIGENSPNLVTLNVP